MENKTALVMAMDLNKHLLSIRFWKYFWKYFWRGILVIAIYMFVLELNGGASLGIALTSFIFTYILMVVFLGFLPLVFYIQVDGIKADAREYSYNILSVVQECLRNGKYKESIDHAYQIKLLNKTKPHPLLYLIDSNTISNY